VRFFSFIMNRMTNSHITDTSTGYRALRVTMLADVVDACASSSINLGVAHHLLEARLARQRSADRVVPARVGETKKGATWTYGFRYARVVFGTGGASANSNRRRAQFRDRETLSSGVVEHARRRLHFCLLGFLASLPCGLFIHESYVASVAFVALARSSAVSRAGSGDTPSPRPRVVPRFWH